MVGKEAQVFKITQQTHGSSTRIKPWEGMASVFDEPRPESIEDPFD
jgi:hypothetical protein